MTRYFLKYILQRNILKIEGDTLLEFNKTTYFFNYLHHYFEHCNKNYSLPKRAKLNTKKIAKTKERAPHH